MVLSVRRSLLVPITLLLAAACFLGCGGSRGNRPTPPPATATADLKASAPAPISVAPASPLPDAAYLDPTRPFADRVHDLLSRMTLEEKASQMSEVSPAIPRLGIPAYRWWSEALHGVARAGVATVFPQAIALAAMWDQELMFQVASVVSDEARAKHHEFIRKGLRGANQGLTFFSPNINIFRDPRWGRGHETYGEDPYLTGRLGVAFIKGLQGDDPKYLKTAATAKHFAVHSGPEADRHRFDARVSPRELWDTYLPHFELAIREGKAESVMSAYNAVNGVPASASSFLLEKVLRQRWGFKGYVVTDCGAVRDIFKFHAFVPTPAKAAAVAVQAGTDLECGNIFKDSLIPAVREGLLAEADLDRAVERLLTTRMRLGMFDPPTLVKWAQIPYAVNDAPAHRELARRAAVESLVLLQNKGNLLPLAPSIKRLAVIGPTADNKDVLLGNYNGEPSRWTTILDGIRAAASNTVVTSAPGGPIIGAADAAKIAEAVEVAKSSETVVLVLGLTPREEGEEGESKVNPSGDRKDIDLPESQSKLLEAIIATRKPTVLVLTGGSALAIGLAKDKVRAILMSWYSGEEGGAAVADVLFGKVSPSGRLPITFYRSTKDLPAFADYTTKNRTYRYFTGEPLFPFGYGLGYTTFRYGPAKLTAAKIGAGEATKLAVDVQNTGKRTAEEVVQVYVTDQKASVTVPLRSLVAWRRVPLEPGEKRTVTFNLDARALSIVDDDGDRIVEPGTFVVAVGGGQPSRDHRYVNAGAGVVARLEVTGSVYKLLE